MPAYSFGFVSRRDCGVREKCAGRVQRAAALHRSEEGLARLGSLRHAWAERGLPSLSANAARGGEAGGYAAAGEFSRGTWGSFEAFSGAGWRPAADRISGQRWRVPGLVPRRHDRRDARHRIEARHDRRRIGGDAAGRGSRVDVLIERAAGRIPAARLPELRRR